MVEYAAVAFGIAYILLAIRQQRACWIAGGISTALFIAVFVDAGLPLQAALQALYVAMSVYGWIAWRPGDGGDDGRPRSWPWPRHLLLLAGVGLASVASTFLLVQYAASDAPLADSLGTWASLAATWLLARRLLETWLWWIVIDAGLAALFASQGLPATALLYLAYAGFAVAGWRAWRRSQKAVT